MIKINLDIFPNIQKLVLNFNKFSVKLKNKYTSS